MLARGVLVAYVVPAGHFTADDLRGHLERMLPCNLIPATFVAVSHLTADFAPEQVASGVAAYNSLEAAGDAVARVVASGLLPGAMEIMDRLARYRYAPLANDLTEPYGFCLATRVRFGGARDLRIV